MTKDEVMPFIGRSVVLTSKKLFVSVVGYVEAVLCDVVIIQGFCVWGVCCADITSIKERNSGTYKSVLDA
ncbi:MAG: hypothetical protein AAB332_00240 [Planctomycetota bacterium]